MFIPKLTSIYDVAGVGLIGCCKPQVGTQHLERQLLPAPAPKEQTPVRRVSNCGTDIHTVYLSICVYTNFYFFGSSSQTCTVYSYFVLILECQTALLKNQHMPFWLPSTLSKSTSCSIMARSQSSVIYAHSKDQLAERHVDIVSKMFMSSKFQYSSMLYILMLLMGVFVDCSCFFVHVVLASVLFFGVKIPPLLAGLLAEVGRILVIDRMRSTTSVRSQAKPKKLRELPRIYIGPFLFVHKLFCFTSRVVLKVNIFKCCLFAHILFSAHFMR